jgi:hypothetical protein
MTPTLVGAIAQACLAKLEPTEDKWARLECPRHYPIVEALDEMGLVRRVGILSSGPEVADLPGKVLSHVPQEITDWRNRVLADGHVPTLVVGDARGNEEAGLIRTSIISTSDIVETWAHQLRTYLDAAGSEYQSVPLRDLIEYLLDQTSEDKLDAPELEQYLIAVLKSTGRVIAAAGAELWRIGLLPDEELLGGKFRSRLALNRQTVDLLTYPADSAADAKRLVRLQQSGSAVAILARHYAATLDRHDLAELDLSAIRLILDGDKPPPLLRPKPLLDLLDVTEDEVDQVIAVLAELDKSVKLDGTTVDLSSQAGKATPETRVHLENNAEQTWTQPREDGESDEKLESGWAQILIGWVEAASQQPDRLNAAVTAQEFAARAVQQDEADGAPVYFPLVEEYVTARSAIGRLEGILANDDEDVLELLIVSSAAQEIAKRYIDAWSALLRTATGDPSSPPSLLMDHLPLLDGRWVVDSVSGEANTVPVGGTLASFHPWRLAPLLKLAAYARTSLGDSELSGKLKWAIDRAVPAYPLIWASPSPLTLGSYVRGVARFESPGGRVLVQSSSGTGLVQVVDSFLEYHPYAKDGLVLTVVNPPAGGGLPAALKQIQAQVARLVVRVVTTVADTADLDALTDVEFLGRYPSLESWLHTSPAPSHVLVAFSETLPSSSGSSLSAGQPLRGSHVSLKIEARAAPHGSKGLRPQLTLCPRDENEVVLLQRNAARLIGGDPALVDTNPTLPAADIRALAKAASTTEWLVVAVPGPVGVVAQAELGDQRLMIGREDFGPYGLYVYADGAYAIRRFLGTNVTQLPIEYTEEQLDEQIARIAKNSPRQILGLSRKHQGVTDTMGVLTALEVERHDEFSTLDAEAFSTFYLPMDEIGWTRHWLGPRLRCDFLRIDVAREIGAPVRIRIRGIESKGSRNASGGPPSDKNEPWLEGIGQVRATLDNLSSIYRWEAPDTISDLRFTSFCEHLFSVAISTLLPIQSKDLPVLQHLSAFSARTLPDATVAFDGMVVGTFYSELAGLQAREVRPRSASDWGIKLVKATSRAVNTLLTGAGLGKIEWISEKQPQEVAADGSPQKRRKRESPSQADSGIEPKDEGPGEPEKVPLTPADKMPAPDAVKLAQDLFAACQRRKFLLGPPKTENITVGPTLVSISLPLVAGASIAEIAHSEKDLAREVGVPSFDISNDPDRPFYVRFVTLRPEREFPALPATLPPSAHPEGGTYLGILLGQDSRGEDKLVYLSTWPHALIGGTTGSGKTTLLRSIVRQVGAAAPRWAQLIVVDGKGESDYYKLIPDNCYAPRWVGPQLEPDSAVDVMEWVIEEELPRRRAIVRARAEALGGRFEARSAYLDAFRESAEPPFLPLLIVVDEFGDLMLRGKRRVAFEDAVQAVGATGRSAMVHMILATQRPELKVVPGIIKGNLPCRIALQLPTAADSMTILGHGGAEQLAGKGDLIFEPPEGSAMRLQSYNA